jgi:glycosyltransferase involved in cell wall biosynthesis
MDIEVIVVDNGSDNDISDRLKTLLAKKINVKFFQNDSNIGMVRNWNKCISYAKGQWMGLLCSDDEYQPGAVKYIYELLNTIKYPSIVLQDSTIADSYIVCKPGTETVRSLRLPLASGNFWHRMVPESIGPFDERLEYSPDAEYWYRAASRFPVIKVKKQLAIYHAHETNYMWETWDKEDFLEQISLLIRLNCRYVLGDQYNDEKIEKEVNEGLKKTLFTILETTAVMGEKKTTFDRYYEIALKMMRNENETQRLSQIISKHYAFLNNNKGIFVEAAKEETNRIIVPITFVVTVYNEESRIRYVMEHAVRWADERSSLLTSLPQI